MLSRLASYLLRGGASGADDAVAAEANGSASDEAAAAAGSIPVEARLRQVEVEGEDWILIDRNVEGVGNMGMDESWYVTPPACFTQPGPVHVETSPLEDLLIEHPSMSVYHSVGSTSSLTQSPLAEKADEVPKQQQPRSKRRAAGQVPAAGAAQATASRLPLATRSSNLPEAVTTTTAVARTTDAGAKKPGSNGSANSNNNRPSHHHHHHHHHHQHGNAAVAEQAPRRSSIRDLRNARGDENVRIVQIRSAQKMLEKRSSQSAKRNRLERTNKAREVSSSKGRRPRRQDRLRLNNSGANNNRKC